MPGPIPLLRLSSLSNSSPTSAAATSSVASDSVSASASAAAVTAGDGASSSFSSFSASSSMLRNHSYPEQSSDFLFKSPGVRYAYTAPVLRTSSTPSGKFRRASIAGVLSGTSNFPFAQQRRVSYEDIRNRTGRESFENESLVDSDILYQESRTPIRASTRLLQSIPFRTSKQSEKLVLIPEDCEPSFHFEDENESGPPPGEGTAAYGIQSDNHKTYAEKISKERRTERYPRLTAYCISDGIRLAPATEYLRANHNILPRLYDEALYAPYHLPLLPGNDGSRVRSSPGGGQLMEELIDQSEMVDHHFEYYSGLEAGKYPSEHGLKDPQVKDTSDAKVQEDINLPRGWRDSPENDFDPSVPQAFSPSPRSDPFMEHVNLDAPRGTNHQSEPLEHSSSDLYDHFDEQTFDYAEQATAQTNETAPMNIQSNTMKANSTLISDLTKHAELFIFSYGVVVFWNFTVQQEKEILADLNFARVHNGISPIPQSLIIRPIAEQEIETEQIHFSYSSQAIKPRIYNDMITLRSGDHMTKLALSHAISQSAKLSRFEARMDNTMHDVKHVPKMLALTGRLGFKREEVLKTSGRLFKLRVDVNLSSNMLDTPDFFWKDEPSLNPLYAAMREYLEIEQRILVLNERCRVFLDLTEIIADSVAEYNMSRITWIIIILIAMSLAVSTLEIAVRFNILREGSKKHVKGSY